MKKSIGILSLALLLLSCQNKSRQEVLTHEKWGAEAIVDSLPQDRDSVDMDDRPLPPPPHQGDTREHKGGNDDNMWGFDPASEDDMPDNGMSRYMENNDEEGWE